jgi:phosphatidylglycerophosphate synthase
VVAVEGGLKTKSGEIFNDLHDRLSDALILVSACHSATWLSWGSTLGWAAAVLAMLTAYVRVLGASAGAGHYFCGPMAKQQSVAVMAAPFVAAALEAAADSGGRLYDRRAARPSSSDGSSRSRGGPAASCPTWSPADADLRIVK